MVDIQLLDEGYMAQQLFPAVQALGSFYILTIPKTRISDEIRQNLKTEAGNGNPEAAFERMVLATTTLPHLPPPLSSPTFKEAPTPLKIVLLRQSWFSVGRVTFLGEYG